MKDVHFQTLNCVLNAMKLKSIIVEIYITFRVLFDT